MTTPRNPNPHDADRLINAFLGEGQTDLPEQVYDEVRAEIEHTEQRTVFGPWRISFMSATSRFLAGAAVAAVVVVAVAVGLLLSRPPLVGGPGPSASASPQPAGVSASVTDGDFRLTVTSTKAAWASDEAIQVEATLQYLGNAAETTLWGSGSGPLGFSVIEATGDRFVGPAFTADCAPHPISGAEPITSPFVKSGGYSSDEPNAVFYEAFFADPLLHLPAGEWLITAGATFDDGTTCTATPTVMEVSITLTVEDAGEPSAAPSASVEPSAEPTGAEPAFICELPIVLDAVGSDFHPLVIADVRLGTHEGYDRITFEYVLDGTPSLRLEGAAGPPFLLDPSGLPVDVAGDAVFLVNFVGATKFDQETLEQPYQGSTDFVPGYEQIAQFVESGDFEGVNNWYLGTNGNNCGMRAFTLTDPSRIVIDIQH